MAAVLVELAPAKINLTLHVTGQRADGYHLLDSLVVFADMGDRLTLRRAEVPALTVTGPMAAGVPSGPENLVLRAARAMGVALDITLEKHLPSAAGIGGGSSDAAAVLRGAVALLPGLELPGDQGLSLGADVPVCLMARAARMRGIGEDVTVGGWPAGAACRAGQPRRCRLDGGDFPHAGAQGQCADAGCLAALAGCG